jgi:hypothetical protein
MRSVKNTLPSLDITIDHGVCSFSATTAIPLSLDALFIDELKIGWGIGIVVSEGLLMNVTTLSTTTATIGTTSFKMALFIYYQLYKVFN